MEYILIAWLMFDKGTSTDAAYAYSMATSISQEFNSQDARQVAGSKLRRPGVNTDMEYKIGSQLKGSWKFVCVPKGEHNEKRPESVDERKKQ